MARMFFPPALCSPCGRLLARLSWQHRAEPAAVRPGIIRKTSAHAYRIARRDPDRSGSATESGAETPGQAEGRRASARPSSSVARSRAAALAPGACIEPCHALRLASGFREFSAILVLRRRFGMKLGCIPKRTSL